MNRILVVGEDELCRALGERLVDACLPDWQLAGPSIDTRGVTRLVPALARYARLAKDRHPVLCIADTDRQCAVTLRDRWLPEWAEPRLLLRLAVSEAESWVLADREGAAEALGVPLVRLPQKPDDEPDPKRLVLTLAARSKKTPIKAEVVSAFDRSKRGTGYNLHLAAFVRSGWDVRRAEAASPSLARAVKRVSALGSGVGAGVGYPVGYPRVIECVCA